jgi:hypothetical protein
MWRVLLALILSKAFIPTMTLLQSELDARCAHFSELIRACGAGTPTVHFVALLLHCSYNVVTQLLHCCYTTSTLLRRLCYTVVTLLRAHPSLWERRSDGTLLLYCCCTAVT